MKQSKKQANSRQPAKRAARVFVPRRGNFGQGDIIDAQRIIDPTTFRFAPIDVRVLEILGRLTQQEILLFYFYNHVGGLDPNGWGLSDYSLREIETALKMSQPTIVKARETLQKERLIALRKQYAKGANNLLRTLVQVLHLDLPDTVVVRRSKGRRAAADSLTSAAQLLNSQTTDGGRGGAFPPQHPAFLKQGPAFRGKHPASPGMRPPSTQQDRSDDRPAPDTLDVRKRKDSYINVSGSHRESRKQEHHLVSEILKLTGDTESVRFWRKLASDHGQGPTVELLLTAITETRLALREKEVRNKGAYFTGVLKKTFAEVGLEL